MQLQRVLQTLDEFSLVVTNFECFNQKEVILVKWGVDLNSSHKGNCSRTDNLRARRRNNSLHEAILYVEESIAQFNLWFTCFLQSLPFWHKHRVHKTLLCVDWFCWEFHHCLFLCSSVEHMGTSSSRTSTTCITVEVTSSQYTSILSGFINTYVRSVYNNTVSAWWNMGCHRPETCNPTESEASKASHRKIFAHVLAKIAIEISVDLITAERGC
mmetsp:Transcript_1179/g.1720  ORF Transcript_1179/g.1720 Transcript_1179/m.1720 type:complete len:214 (-) Transcript_1179:264-905(-)